MRIVRCYSSRSKCIKYIYFYDVNTVSLALTPGWTEVHFDAMKIYFIGFFICPCSLLQISI